MVLGNVERLEVVIRSFHLRSGHDRIAEREKTALDLVEGLAQRMPRAERARYAGERKILALACMRLLVGRGFQGRTLVRAHSFDMLLQRIEFLTDDALQFRSRRF